MKHLLILLFSMSPILSHGASRTFTNASGNQLKIYESGTLSFKNRVSELEASIETGLRGIEDAVFSGNNVKLFLASGESCRLVIDPLSGEELKIIFTPNERGGLCTKIVPTGRMFLKPTRKGTAGARD